MSTDPKISVADQAKKTMNENSVWALISELSSKKGITEIAFNSPQSIFVEREGQFIQLNVSVTKTEMYQFIKDVADYNKKKCDEHNPVMDGNLPDGSRVNVIVEPFSAGSPAITIRRYLKSLKSLESAGQMFGLDSFWVQFLRAAVVSRANFVVCGGTGAGKTTLMNMLLAEIPNTERLVTIEDTLELDIPQSNLIRLEAKSVIKNGDKSSLTMRELVKNALRMRPDRIIIGEVRGGEFFDLMQAMNTGHDGSMCSIHANTPTECLGRMESLYMMSDIEMPLMIVKKQIASAINFIVQIGRDRNGHRRVVAISEITGMEGTNILMQQLAKFEDGIFHRTGIVPKIINNLHEKGGLPLDFFSRS